MSEGKQKVKPFLMFEGQAEEAMNFYTSLFDQSEIVSIERYGPAGPGPEGSVVKATFSIHGQQIMCSDSPVKHAFSFTPSISLFVTCDTVEEINRVFETLSKDGKVYMGLATYPFSERFGWVGDRFGVTWQLSLEK
ncbi:VOC family protein [Paenibacillus sp. LjRoot56]|uniref:VOC family protein n=1 Tax=Paenibacillus sp. LjRoot56 TaxID=3342333 RepID=UPI003F4FF05E